MNFAAILRQLRLEKGISQKELAIVLRVSVGTVSNYENGVHSPDLAMLCVIADYFEVSTDYLLGRTDCRCSENTLKKCIAGTCTVSDLLNPLFRLPEADRMVIVSAAQSMARLMDALPQSKK